MELFERCLLEEKPSELFFEYFPLATLETLMPDLYRCIDFPQFHPSHLNDVFTHILCVVDATPPKLELRVASLFHDIGKPYCLQIIDGVGQFPMHPYISAFLAHHLLTGWGYNSEFVYHVKILIHEHMAHHSSHLREITPRYIKRIKPYKDDLLLLMDADAKSHTLKSYEKRTKYITLFKDNLEKGV